MSGARILCVEDNPANMQLMTYLLGAYGHTPVPAVDGFIGLEEAATQPPDLVLLDLQLPGIDGREVLRRLRKMPTMSSVPIIAVTAFAMVGDRDDILAEGFNGYIPKPIDPELFVEQVQRHLDPRMAGHLDRAEPVAAAPEQQVLTPARQTILVVDDVSANTEVLAGTLEPSGYRLLIAATVEQAEELARGQTPDLILCDVHMPIEGGFELLERFKSDPVLGGIPIGLMSSSGAIPKNRRRAESLGAKFFLSRPVDPSELLRTIDEFFSS